MDDAQEPEGISLRHSNTLYYPSVWISCVLIFWTALCILRDLSVPKPWVGIVFTVTTYAPTIYSAGKSILQGSRRGRSEAHDAVVAARTRARRASIIAATWIVTATARVALRRWTDRVHAAHVPERPVLCIVIFLALRHVLDKRARKRGGGIALPAEDHEERDTHQAPVHAGTAAAYNHGEASMHMYRPSDTLLALSIFTCLLSLICEGLLLIFGISTFSSILQATIPTIIFHIFMLARPHSELELQAQFIRDADFSLELTAIWLATRPFVFFRAGFIPGLLELLVLSYMSVRYALGLWNALPRYEQFL